jgi:hypothetical protein
MAPRPQANERTEREFALDVNQAVANTEAEIFGDALGDDELELDGDTSLEEMGEGLEGETLDEEGETEEAGEQAEGEEGDEVAAATEESDEEAEDETGEVEDNQTQDEQIRQEGDQRGRIPPGVHRQERERRRAAEEHAQRVERELAETRGRLDELSRRVNTPPPAAKVEPKDDPEPDMFADPEGWKTWNRRQAEKIADERVQHALGTFEQRQQERVTERVNQSFNLAANGERNFEFDAAYRALVSLDPRNPQHQATVRRIYESAEPSQALFDWWDNNGGPEYRDELARRLGFEPEGGRREQRRGTAPSQRGQPRQQFQQPRHETRLPPSLNTARGGQRQAVSDPDMLDDSDQATFRYATR